MHVITVSDVEEYVISFIHAAFKKLEHYLHLILISPDKSGQLQLLMNGIFH